MNWFFLVLYLLNATKNDHLFYPVFHFLRELIIFLKNNPDDFFLKAKYYQRFFIIFPLEIFVALNWLRKKSFFVVLGGFFLTAVSDQ